jgi:hypothetical protein
MALTTATTLGPVDSSTNMSFERGRGGVRRIAA